MSLSHSIDFDRVWEFTFDRFFQTCTNLNLYLTIVSKGESSTKKLYTSVCISIDI